MELNEKQILVENEIKEARNSLSSDKLDLSYGEIVSMYNREDLIIYPDFQRLFRWDDEQKTRFIESLLLGIPIPPIFVAEDKSGKWELVDGLQRISTVLSFFGELKDLQEKNNWKLLEGDIVKQFEDMSFNDLPILFQRNLRRTYCRVEILKWDSKYDMRYELFNRLNTGGSSLTEQEIRNCIFRGTSSEFNNFLERIAQNNKFIELISLTEKKTLESYAQELVLRIVSLNKDWDKMSTKKMSSHMTKFMENAVKEEFDYSIEEKINKAINLLHPLGTEIFRFNNNQLSTSLFDAIFVNVINNIDDIEKLTASTLKTLFDNLKNDEEFRNYTGSNSSSSNRIKNRMKRAEVIFQEYLKCKI